MKIKGAAAGKVRTAAAQPAGSSLREEIAAFTAGHPQIQSQPGLLLQHCRLLTDGRLSRRLAIFWRGGLIPAELYPAYYLKKKHLVLQPRLPPLPADHRSCLLLPCGAAPLLYLELKRSGLFNELIRMRDLLQNINHLIYLVIYQVLFQEDSLHHFTPHRGSYFCLAHLKNRRSLTARLGSLDLASEQLQQAVARRHKLQPDCRYIRALSCPTALPRSSKILLQQYFDSRALEAAEQRALFKASAGSGRHAPPAADLVRTRLQAGEYLLLRDCELTCRDELGRLLRQVQQKQGTLLIRLTGGRQSSFFQLLNYKLHPHFAQPDAVAGICCSCRPLTFRLGRQSFALNLYLLRDPQLQALHRRELQRQLQQLGELWLQRQQLPWQEEFLSCLDMAALKQDQPLPWIKRKVQQLFADAAVEYLVSSRPCSGQQLAAMELMCRRLDGCASAVELDLALEPEQVRRQETVDYIKGRVLLNYCRRELEQALQRSLRQNSAFTGRFASCSMDGLQQFFAALRGVKLLLGNGCCRVLAPRSEQEFFAELCRGNFALADMERSMQIILRRDLKQFDGRCLAAVNDELLLQLAG